MKITVRDRPGPRLELLVEADPLDPVLSVDLENARRQLTASSPTCPWPATRRKPTTPCAPSSWA